MRLTNLLLISLVLVVGCANKTTTIDKDKFSGGDREALEWLEHDDWETMEYDPSTTLTVPDGSTITFSNEKTAAVYVHKDDRGRNAMFYYDAEGVGGKIGEVDCSGNITRLRSVKLLKKALNHALSCIGGSCSAKVNYCH